MRNTQSFTTLGTAILLAYATTANAQILLEDDLSSSAGWTVLGTADGAATFGYDYSLDGIPEAPNSVGGPARTGLKMEANLTLGATDEIAAVPDGFDLSGRYRIQVDIWNNYAILSGFATEYAGAFAGHDGATAGRSGSGFLYNGDGDSTRDYRLYKNTSEMFLEGGYYSPPLGELPNDVGPPRSNNNQHPVMMTAYPAFDIGLALEPDDAQGLDQVGLGAEGAGGMQWMTLEIIADSAGLPGGGVGVGTAEARLTSATSGNMLWMGTADSNRGDVASTSGAPALVYLDFGSSAEFPEFNFGVFDNLIIEQLQSTVNGDFDNNGLWNCNDINALSAAIVAGSTDLSFDMNGDGSITGADITDAGVGWLAVGGANNPAATSGGNPFLNADANLDGTVDGPDFLVWNGTKFTNTDQWCAGDFNADGVSDGQDFLIWNGNKFLSSDHGAAAVPEPATVVLLLPVLVAIFRRWASKTCC